MLGIAIHKIEFVISKLFTLPITILHLMIAYYSIVVNCAYTIGEELLYAVVESFVLDPYLISCISLYHSFTYYQIEIAAHPDTQTHRRPTNYS